MARCFTLLLVLAGCGRFSFDPSRPDASADTAADTFVCLTPAGHDEDADGVDDACDVCPQLADDQRDTDGDSIGDACDHAPTTQTRTLFDPFTSARPDWMFDTRTTFRSDSIGLPGVNDSIGIRLEGMPGRAVYETGGRITAIGATGSHQVAIHIGSATGPNNYYCELYNGGSGLLFMLTHTPDGVSFNNLAAAMPGGMFAAGSYRIVFVHTPPDLTCIGWWNGIRYEVTGTDPGGVPIEELAIAVNNMDTEIDYFVRLSTP